jgi:50S ribosomal protein L16 3-hydroxylase
MQAQRWLGENCNRQFVENYFHKLPFSSAGSAAGCCELGHWENLASMLAQDGADLLVCRANERYSGDAPRTADEARRLNDEGYTILLRHAERHEPRLARLAADFRADFAGPVNVHVYATPAGQYGFGWHYDAEDVFIVQTTGRKEYSLRKNTVHPWPLEETLPEDMRYGREIMPLMRCLLAAGDWLYIPAGYWHMGAAEETAISLAIGVMSPSAMTAYDLARRQFLDSLLWRQRFPTAGAAAPWSEAELRARYREILEQLADDFRRTITSELFLSRLLEELRAGGTEESK